MYVLERVYRVSYTKKRASLVASQGEEQAGQRYKGVVVAVARRVEGRNSSEAWAALGVAA